MNAGVFVFASFNLFCLLGALLKKCRAGVTGHFIG
jgi:hypothetical protein